MTDAVLELEGDRTELLRSLIDIESVSGNEQRIADAVQAALGRYSHLAVSRIDNVIFARTELGRAQRVVIAGHLDTVPIAGNVPAKITGSGADMIIHGRGACDMKGGVAVQLAAAAALTAPSRDITWMFYDNEEVDAKLNGLYRISRQQPELLDGDFAVLCEPSNAGIEGGCQGTMRVNVVLTGVAAHSARSWNGQNAIHAAHELLRRLADFRTREVTVDGLVYREGLNAVRIDGGIANNVVPDRCEVLINYRFAPDKDLAAAEAYLREVLAGYECTVVDGAPGARPGLDQPIAAEFVAAVGGEVQPKYGWTDVARFAELGVPAVNFGPGDPNKAHADDEFCPAADLERCYAGLLAWLG
ncbi:succinyl-diaminopimelate desuccinylase [Microlunatus speluncae]|uniref:succinyl-diaminopimelate desuccinylase n=1 Tax=Microlunatus speluncae TaxID=2594267 RepID=UPI001FE3D57C|nr:succinyl-diaminopimelate desuccinylase [Microlunatus speluncae]